MGKWEVRPDDTYQVEDAEENEQVRWWLRTTNKIGYYYQFSPDKSNPLKDNVVESTW